MLINKKILELHIAIEEQQIKKG